METRNRFSRSILMAIAEYEEPELTVIGEASDVVLGVAVGGFDGTYQMTEAEFEFEADDVLE